MATLLSWMMGTPNLYHGKMLGVITKHPSIKNNGWLRSSCWANLKFYPCLPSNFLHNYPKTRRSFRKFPPTILVKIYHLTFSKHLQFSIFSVCILVITPTPHLVVFFWGGANSTRSFSTSPKDKNHGPKTPRPRTCSKGCCATQRSPLDHDFGEKSSDSSEMDDFADFSRHLQ